MKSVFFLPVYNQIEEFPAVLHDLQSTKLPCDTVLLVNNGSTDGSETLVRKSGYPYIDLSQNRGIGHSYRLALLWSMERDYEVFGIMASNGKMLAGEMATILDPIFAGETDYVTGSRFLDGGESPNLPVFRQASIPLVNLFVKVVIGARLTDATCGYRAFVLSLIRRAEFDWKAEWLDTYGFEYYLYAKVILDGKVRWREVPITMRYPAKGKRYSKIRPILDWWAMLKPWLAARLDPTASSRTGPMKQNITLLTEPMWANMPFPRRTSGLPQKRISRTSCRGIQLVQNRAPPQLPCVGQFHCT